jgi:hypothetical protein
LVVNGSYVSVFDNTSPQTMSFTLTAINFDIVSNRYIVKFTDKVGNTVTNPSLSKTGDKIEVEITPYDTSLNLKDVTSYLYEDVSKTSKPDYVKYTALNQKGNV